VEERTIPVGVRLPISTANALSGRTFQFEFKISPRGQNGEKIQVREKSTFFLPR
jgi:hypothetical protein